MSLDGKVTVITGAARGIGRAVALACAREGADLVLLDVAHDIDGCPYPLGTVDQLKETARRCAAVGAPVATHHVDVRDREACQRAVEQTIDRCGRIDLLVNSAGLAAPSGQPVYEVGEDEWRLIVDVNLDGTWRMLQLVSAEMVKAGSGSIVNIASTAGLVGYRHFSAYVAAKHAVIGLTKAAALDLAPLGVRVNAVAPGSVRDEPELDGRMLLEIANALQVGMDEYETTFATGQPTNRLVRAADVAAACVWLGSDESADVIGSVVTVDGGFTAH